ncbi:MAG: signal peptide peptidase SppA [Desulfatibacillaceae bacterium]|nr:signal peptide peptidase SppA [Desulfatibacillaceae bacterium]
MKRCKFAALLFGMVLALALTGCVAPNIKLFSDAKDPLAERVLSGKSEPKILVVPITGVISDTPERDFLRDRPSMLQEVVSHLDKARKDGKVAALVLVINSPGGSAGASDILYNEIMSFKQKTDAKVVAVMMDVATSGGFYVSLAADYILAHPNTVTGSVGVILLRPDLTGLMDKLGVEVTAQTSGRNKDMGSPFRPASDEEFAIFQGVADSIAGRFLGLVAEHRKPDAASMELISTARIFTAPLALEHRLIDGIGYMEKALETARSLAGLPDDAKVIAYRRSDFPDDNIYNMTTMQARPGKPLVDLGLPAYWSRLAPGYYYLWLPGVE